MAHNLFVFIFIIIINSLCSAIIYNCTDGPYKLWKWILLWYSVECGVSNERGVVEWCNLIYLATTRCLLSVITEMSLTLWHPQLWLVIVMVTETDGHHSWVPCSVQFEEETWYKDWGSPLIYLSLCGTQLSALSMMAWWRTLYSPLCHSRYWSSL